MWEDNNYCWVVLCKNNWFHRRESLFYKHRIPLAETDVYAPVPALKSSFTARCDECHKEYLYKPSDVLRHDQELPVSFIPHPLFQLDFMPRAVELTEQKAVEIAAGADRLRKATLALEVVLFLPGQNAVKDIFPATTVSNSANAHRSQVG